MLNKCESPIERILMQAVMDLYPVEIEWKDFANVRELLRWHDNVGVTEAIIAVPQLVVEKYRVDFFFVGNNFIGPPAIMMAVECDGHDYHERTKEQAARDRKRDRYLTYLEVMPMRFTGSEIVADAAACAQEIYSVMSCRERESMRSFDHYYANARRQIGNELLGGSN
jgi:very-short-patch-repair endonuclease